MSGVDPSVDRTVPDTDGPVKAPGARPRSPSPVPSPSTKSTTGSKPATGPGSLAPSTPESFDELAKRVAKAEPRRGSIVQPPPAWEPDEATLGFAMVTDPSGEVHELPEPTLLATMLIAVENDRRGIMHRVAAGFEEEIDAVASLYWPFLVLRGGPKGEVAIFDGTGVWKRTFRYTRMPAFDGFRALVDPPREPADLMARMRVLTPSLSSEAGSELLTVEGFLPIDPPLLFDVLTQSQFRTDPQAPHAGFLPARHKVDWYEEELDQMRAWLGRFEADLKALGELRAQVEAVVKSAQARLEKEFAKRQEEANRQALAAAARADAEVDQLLNTHHAEVKKHLDAIRQSHGVVARSEADIATSETLAFRAGQRRVDPGPHQARGRQAQNASRSASRQIAESRRAIEKIHERQRAAQEEALARVAQVEQANAKALAEQELFRDEFTVVATDLLQSIDGQVAARSTQRNVLSGYFLPLPSLASIRVVWFPLWMATLRSAKEVRQIVFPPMQVRRSVGIGGALKRLMGGIVLPLEPRTAQFDKVLRPTMEEALVRDPWLCAATRELTRAADVLVDVDVLERFQEGLTDLKREGWITQKQQEDYRKAYLERAARHAVAGRGPPASVPIGARVEGTPDTRSAPVGPPRPPGDRAP